jgi:hypothetical protein
MQLVKWESCGNKGRAEKCTDGVNMEMLGVLETAKHVAEKSRHVRIEPEALRRLSRELARGSIPIPGWDDEHHFRGDDEATLAYLLVLDAINFCFWPPPGRDKWEISHEQSAYSGYYALSVSLKKALESGIPLTDARFLASLTLHQMKEILSGRGVLQLIEQRLENLRELGRVLLENYDGKASQLVAAARCSAVALARLLATNLTSFRDEAVYQGEKVFFYKRAQLLAADIHGAFAGKGWGSFGDVEELTAFADYKLPQVLRHVGVLDYSAPLAKRIDELIYLDPGSPEEVEIRANTIWAVEMIRQELERLGRKLRAFEIDWILWNLGQDDEFRQKPYHRTVTIFY